MIIPEGVDSRLGELLAEHAKHGLVPCKCLLDSLLYAADFSAFHSELGLSDQSILIVGGRTFKENDILGGKCVLFEDRSRFTSYNSVHNKDTVSALEDRHIATADTIFIHADYIAETIDLPPLLQRINQVIRQETKLIIVVRHCFDASAGIRHGPDGSQLDWHRYRTWFDSVRSHMHMGFVTHEFENTSFIDLGYTYPFT